MFPLSRPHGLEVRHIARALVGANAHGLGGREREGGGRREELNSSKA